MKRRSFLQLLGLAPVAGTAAVLAKNTAIGVKAVDPPADDKIIFRFTPVEYTRMEGGGWCPWEHGSIDLQSKYPNGLDGINVAMVQWGDKPWNTCRVHALKFEDGREWDTVNGWRDMELMARCRGERRVQSVEVYETDFGVIELDKPTLTEDMVKAEVERWFK